MDSAFCSYVDDTIEDAFDASSDTEIADDDDDTPIAQPGHMQLNCELNDTNGDSGASFDMTKCHTDADWFSRDSRQELLPNDNFLQGNSTSHRLPTAAGLRLSQPSAESKCSLTASNNISRNIGLSSSDVHHSERSQQRTSRCHDNLYVSESDRSSSRQSLLQNRTHANSRFPMSKTQLSASTNHVASAMYLPDDDDKVMEIVEEQLENDDDDDEDDDNSDTDIDDVDDVNDDEEEDDCVVDVDPVSAADADVEDVDTDAEESEVDEVEEMSEDEEPEDRLVGIEQYWLFGIGVMGIAQYSPGSIQYVLGNIFIGCHTQYQYSLVLRHFDASSTMVASRRCLGDWGGGKV